MRPPRAFRRYVDTSTPGAFAGTPEFASPEQFAGVPVDIRSDLYSLGATLWEMVTGHVVFRGSAAEVMHQHAPLPLEQLEGAPQPVIILLKVLLEKDPARRFQTPTELLAVIPVVKGAIEAGRRLMKTVRVFVRDRRRPKGAALGGSGYGLDCGGVQPAGE
jgi:serine/threonine protein kinase